MPSFVTSDLDSVLRCAGMGICAQDQELAAAAVNMNKVRLAARHPTGYAVLASKRARASAEIGLP